MRVLHIVNDYNFTKVHMNLCRSIDSNSVIEQTIFIPLRSEDNIGKNHFEFRNVNSEFVYSKRLLKYHKVFFRDKIKFLLRSLLEQVDVKKDIDIVHASTLYSDGALALSIKEKYNVPYIVAVRNTDIFTFSKYRKDLLLLAKSILDNAKKVIFISDANFRVFKNTLAFKLSSRIKSKVINNGVDDFWLSNISKYKYDSNKDNFNFVYVGRFDNNKNVVNLIKAFNHFNANSSYENKLYLVGGGGEQEQQVINMIDNTCVFYNGFIDSKDKLREVFSMMDFFCMCSHTETFGLVYIEALSQGKPILYTINQGVDNSFDSLLVGVGVESKSQSDISKGFEDLVLNNFEDINSIDFNRFAWKNIAQEYVKLYND